jgi:predicted ArsR family transcriptional regulator
MSSARRQKTIKTTPATPTSRGKNRGRTKQARILALLRRQTGASIQTLTKETGWQPHSVRAALTGLRNRGLAINRSKDASGITIYHLDVGGTS